MPKPPLVFPRLRTGAPVRRESGLRRVDRQSRLWAAPRSTDSGFDGISPEGRGRHLGIVHLQGNAAMLASDDHVALSSILLPVTRPAHRVPETGQPDPQAQRKAPQRGVSGVMLLPSRLTTEFLPKGFSPEARSVMYNMLGFIKGLVLGLVHRAGLLVSPQVGSALGWRDANVETASGNYIKGAEFSCWPAACWKLGAALDSAHRVEVYSVIP